MLKNKLGKFVVKRTFILLVFLTILCLVFYKQKLPALIGLYAGTVFGLLKFGSMAEAFGQLFSSGNSKPAGKNVIIRYIVQQGATVILLIATILLDINLFAGAVTGVLIVPSIIFINGITEGLGITHNNFE